MLAQGEPGEKGEGVAGKAQNEGQEEIGPAYAGGFQPEESGKRVADSDASKQPRHDLVEFHLAAIQNGASEKHQDLQQKQHGNMVRTLVVPAHCKNPRDDT